MPKIVGLYYNCKEGRHMPVLLRSTAIRTFMERDGMSMEDAEEYWEYTYPTYDGNIISVDDMIPPEIMEELLNEEREEEFNKGLN